MRVSSPARTQTTIRILNVSIIVIIKPVSHFYNFSFYLHTYLSSLSLIKQVPIVYEQDLLDKYKGVRSGGRPFDSKSTLGRCNTHFVLSLFLQAEHHFEF